MNKYFLLIIIILLSFEVIGQGVGISSSGGNSPNSSAILDVVSSNKGLLIPRIALTSTTDVSTITNGNVVSLLVFNTSTVSDIVPGYYYWNGNEWKTIGGGDADADPINEIQDLQLTGNNLIITNNAASTTIDLTPYLDNTDNQTLSLSGNTLSISNGNNITLVDNVNDADFDPTNEIELPKGGLNGQVLTTNGSGVYSWVSSSSGTDNQTLSLSGNTLSISNGNNVTLVDNVNDADFDPTNEIELPTGGSNGQVLTTNGSGVYSWSNSASGTDNQTLSISGNTLSISNGNNITLVDNVNDADANPLNEIQDLQLVGNNLRITNNTSATTINLSPYLDNTDSQNISGSSFNASTGNLVIGISNGTNQTVNLNGLADDDWYEVGTTSEPNSINDNIYTQGNVGIGTTSPAKKLDVNGELIAGSNVTTQGNTSNKTFMIGDDNSYLNGGGGSNTTYMFGKNNTHNTSGNGSRSAFIFGRNNSITSGIFPSAYIIGENITVTSGNRIAMGIGGESVSILNSGRVGIGTTAPSQILTVFNGTSTGTYTTSGWIHTSDKRLKTNVAGLEGSLDKLKQIEGVNFDWKSSTESKRQIGFLAQDLQKVLPEAVVVDEEGNYGVAYGNLTPLLVEAIKEQQILIEQLRTELNEVKRTIRKNSKN